MFDWGRGVCGGGGGCMFCFALVVFAGVDPSHRSLGCNHPVPRRGFVLAMGRKHEAVVASHGTPEQATDAPPSNLAVRPGLRRHGAGKSKRTP